MDLRVLYSRALGSFCDRVRGVPAGAWGQPTPCEQWDVRALVQHLVGEWRWVPPLVAGATIDEIGDRFEGDLLGDDPVQACTESAAAAVQAVAAASLDDLVHLSFGDARLEEFLWQLTTDALVHTWDLARATGQPETLDPEVVEACAAWFTGAEALYRSEAVIAPAVPVGADADPASRLIARFGRDPSPDAPLAVIVRFNAAFGRHDLEALARIMTEDAVFEDTTPPDGIAHVGRDAALAAFAALFRDSPSASFVTEGAFWCAERIALQWRYDWAEQGGGHVRGVDLFTVRDGRVAVKVSYVKG